VQKRITYFLAVANCLSFTQAAKQLFISQQALTRQIALLEDDLGVKLFVRSTRAVHLTEAGKVCRDEFSRLNLDLEAAIDRVRSVTLANTSVFTIGFQSSFSRQNVITPIMESLYSNFPDVDFRIKLYDFKKMRYSLLDGNCDLCIAISSDWKNWTHISASVLRQLVFKIIVSKNHPLTKEPQRYWEKLGDYKWLKIGDLDVISEHQPAWYNQIPCTSRVNVGDLLTVLAYVEAGQGFSCQPTVFLGMETNSMKEFPIPIEEARLDMICAYSDTMKNPLGHSISRYLKQQFASNQYPNIR